MLRRTFLQLAAAAPLAAARRPNVIMILADDLGYAGIGVQGCKDVPTPRIDSIAASGVRFTSGYVSCPVCSPTRAGLMTGRYQQRFGHEFNPGPADQAEENFGLPLSETTIADRMKALGYRTGMVGKWHLGYKPDLHPTKRGFEEFFGFLGGANDYFHTERRQRDSIYRGTEKVEEKEYLTRAFAREAAAFIERRKTDPFFLYLAFNAVHGPLQADKEYLARFSTIAEERRRTHAAMLTALDDGVGAVLDKVRGAGLENDTLILFVSDNGGPTPQTTSSNAPLRGFKGQVWEGGIRVPFLAKWKGTIPAGRTVNDPVIALDVLPTAVAAAGGAVPRGLDGVNLLPRMTGKSSAAPHESLYWRFGAQGAIRKGDWKLTRLQGEAPHLANLGQDIGEQKNLAETEPAKLRELTADWDKWNAELKAPAWRTERQGRAERKKKR